MPEATIRTAVSEPDIVASALEPDNTESMTTTVERSDGQAVVLTTIDRDSTSGLRSTLDDYVVNLGVATDVVQLANRHDTPTHE